MDFEGISIIRYFGSSFDVEIPKRIEKLSRCCFNRCSSVHRVIFESNAEVSVIEESAFKYSGLASISIPRSVVVLELKCFSHCAMLKVVSFEAGSKLSVIGNDILAGSGNIERIDIPETILVVCSGRF
jgi:hypothetical protein